MVTGPLLILVFAIAIAFIIVMTARIHMNAFLVLLLAAFMVGLLSGMDPVSVIAAVTGGFGTILGSIGIVIITGTIIGTILEKSRATLTMADTVLKLVGEARAAAAMAVTGAVISIPVFCDSAFVILSALNRSLARRTGVSMTTMTVALTSGLIVTHTFVPPTPGPIAAAGNLNADIGLVILFGLMVSVPIVAVGYLWAVWIGRKLYVAPPPEIAADTDRSALPGVFDSFAPIFIPISLISLRSIADFPGHPFGTGGTKTFFDFFGDPTVALIIGVFLAFRLMPRLDEEHLHGWVGDGLKNAASILMITGAGGAFGATLKATPIGDYLSGTLAQYPIGIFLPFVISVSLKIAQGSATVCLVTTSALLAPLLGDLGLGSELGRVLTVLAIGAGATVGSHANDSYFWVVSQFSGLDTPTMYKAHTMGTIIQGCTGMAVVWVLSLVVL